MAPPVPHALHGLLRALAGAGLALLGACSSEAPPAPPGTAQAQPGATLAPAFRTTAPVDERCAACHAELAEAYAGSAMARALGVPTAAELDALAGLAPAESGAGFAYGVFKTPDGKGHVVGETLVARGGHAFGAEIVRAIGAGVRDRSLAVRHGAGLYFAPAEVLTDREGAGERYLAPAPGESMHPGTRFTFAITDECLGCHTSEPLDVPYPMHHIAPQKLPVNGIGCAGCHGDEGALDAHVAFQEAALAGEPVGSEPLLDLAALGRTERMSICAACHLQGDARVVLKNQSLGRHTIGADLGAERATFVGRVATADVGFVSQTERLVLSACYLESDMDCATCHDPHRPLQDVTAKLTRNQELTRRACLDCHATEACNRPVDTPLPSHALGQEALDCVTCHMPRVEPFDVDGVTIHDHFVRRTAAAGVAPATGLPLRFPESPSGDWKRFRFPGQAQTPKGDELGLWMMALTAIGQRTQAAAHVDAPPGAEAEGLAMYHHVRATLLEELGRVDDARAAYERALALDPQLGPATVNLALLHIAADEAPAALGLLDALLAKHPTADGALRNRALAKQALGDLAGAQADLERAFQITPSGELARVLGSWFGAAGPNPDMGRAEMYARLAEELDPR